jgi:two-component system response regulator HydG
MTEQSRRILLVDQDEAFGQLLQSVLGSGYLLTRASRRGTGNLQPDLVDTDVVLLNLDAESGGEASPKVLERLRSLVHQEGAPPVVAFGWDPHRRVAVEAFRQGAVDFLEQPLDVQELKFALIAACRHAAMARGAAKAPMGSAEQVGLFGNSKPMQQVNDVIRKVAGVFTSVLITGESGTGKGVAARAIHRLSQRANKPFVEFSLCTLPESLIEDELFGHERGAFTGANNVRKGRFEEANGGTIFLDEIGDLALPLQAKLLRVLQERTVERLGSNTPHAVDVRVICATNRNLEKMVREGTFREDLYFRISVVKIQMPALRERGDDVPLLAEHFLDRFAKAYEKPARGFTPGFLSSLAVHNWPGNVRELQNVIERSLVLANGNPYLGVEDLPQELRRITIADCDDLPTGAFHEAIRSLKRELVRSALRMHEGNKLQAARELGISRCYLHRLLNQLNITEGPVAGAEVENQLTAEGSGRLGLGSLQPEYRTV